jgi:pseudouridine-5'-phosphate glycosidase
MNNNFLKIQPEVKEALDQGLPVVALESTIISHGMPWPKNVETAQSVENKVRENGAVPATIAIIDGKCCIGLSTEELEYFGKEKQTWKVSLRDIPYVISKRIPGATTVAATMRIASMAGIQIFATGGTGGVHRNAEVNMDISADLTEMAGTNVAIVSAGVKSILDIGLTLEYLETMGIPVVTFGQDEFPSFYSSKSGYQSPLRLDSTIEIAEMCLNKWSLGLNGAVLIANPVPQEKEVSAELIEEHVKTALEAAQKAGISGKEITPYLLKYIADHSSGESLEANIALIENNASLAARVAVDMCKIKKHKL